MTNIQTTLENADTPGMITTWFEFSQAQMYKNHTWNNGKHCSKKQYLINKINQVIPQGLSVLSSSLKIVQS